MRIGYFTDAYFPEIDGVTYTLKLWRDRLEAAGHDVWIVYPDGSYTPRERELPVPSMPNPFYPGYRIGLPRRVSSLPEFDLVHCHGPGPVGLLGSYCAQKRDLPAVYTHHTPIEEYFHQSVKSRRIAQLLHRLYVPIENSFLERFDVVTASTGQINRSVEAIRLPVGVDMEFFLPTGGYSIPGQTLIGYSGRISMEKNVREVSRLARRLSACDFVVVGEGPMRGQIAKDAPENVSFRDFMPRGKLPGFYTSLDVFVTASTADTLGLSTLEANACGTPVAAVDAPPFDRTIGSENGIRYEYGDVDGMANAVDRCLEAGWRTRPAVEPFSIDRTMDRLETIYQELITEDPAPVPLQV